MAIADDNTQPLPPTSRGRATRGRPSRRGIGGRGRSRAPERNDQLKWENRQFRPQQGNNHAQGDQNRHPQSTINQRQNWTPSDYFVQYMDTNLFETIATATNQTSVLNTGRSLHKSQQRRFEILLALTS